jgi:hypothetical protein
MKTLFTTIAGSALIVGAWVSSSPAQIPICPPEVASAKAMLNARGSDAQASARSRNTEVSRGQNVQAARSQDVQAPRNQDVQAPRNQDVQAPRSQDVQAPRNQDVQAPRGQDVPAPRDNRYGQTSPERSAPGAPLSAQALVREAEAACQQGRTAEAREKALAALEIMKR